jgi:hypothetical protein
VPLYGSWVTFEARSGTLGRVLVATWIIAIATAVLAIAAVLTLMKDWPPWKRDKGAQGAAAGDLAEVIRADWVTRQQNDAQEQMQLRIDLAGQHDAIGPRFPWVLYGVTLAGVASLISLAIAWPAYRWLALAFSVAAVAILLGAVLVVHLPRRRWFRSLSR